MFCYVCQKIDLRSLILVSANSHSKTFTDEIDTFRYHSELQESAEWHNDILSLAEAADNGCGLCLMVLKTAGESMAKRLHNGNAILHPDVERLASEFPGKLFLGTSSWRNSDQSCITECGDHPEVIVTAIDRSNGRTHDRLICRLSVMIDSDCTREGDPGLLALLPRQAFKNPASRGCLSLGAQWLKSCRENHSKCAIEYATLPELPKRVIYVGSDDLDPFLHIPKPGTTGSWIALSYCWGGASDFVLTKSRFHELRHGFALHTVPQTIQDAILITRSLGQKYLWVDALCILQRDRHDNDQSWKDDWASEAPKMAEIYKNSVVTITASASTSARSGIFQDRETSLSCQMPWRIPIASSGEPSTLASHQHVVHLSPKLTQKDVNIPKPYWHQRGWTFQERLLSTRNLDYALDRTSWRCSSTAAAETTGYRISGKSHDIATELESFAPAWDRPSVLSHSTRKLYRLWYDIAEEYKTRDLAEVEDRLPAVAGLAKRINTHLNDDYCAGLWRRDILCGLLWIGHNFYPNTTPVYVGPSWSWIQIACRRISWEQSWANQYIQELTRIETVEIELRHVGSAYGQLNEAVLTMNGPFFRLNALVHPENTTDYGYFESFVQAHFKDPASPHSHEFRLQHRSHPGQHFAALQLIVYCTYKETIALPTIAILLLESVETDGNRYRRVGLISVREVSANTAAGEDVNPDEMGHAEHNAFLELQEIEWEVKTISLV